MFVWDAEANVCPSYHVNIFMSLYHDECEGGCRIGVLMLPSFLSKFVSLGIEINLETL